MISKLHGYNSPNRQRTLLSKCLILKLKILLNTLPFGLVNVLLKFCHFFFQLKKNNKCIVNTEPQLYSIKYISSNLESIYLCNVQGRVYNLTQNVHYIKQVINRKNIMFYTYEYVNNKLHVNAQKIIKQNQYNNNKHVYIF